MTTQNTFSPTPKQMELITSHIHRICENPRRYANLLITLAAFNQKMYELHRDGSQRLEASYQEGISDINILIEGFVNPECN